MPNLNPARLLFLLAVGLCLWGCPGADSPPPPAAETPLGAVELLTFIPDDEYYLLPGHRYPLEPATPLREAFQRLADQLARVYFDDGRTPAAEIRLEVIGFHTIDLPHRAMRVVAVNLHDPRQTAWGAFFQGSAGGQTTYYLLAATLMQPQLTPPLADGLVVLYNGEAFPELDHIRFRGIVSAESVRPAVVRAIQRRPPRPTGVSG